MGKIDQLHEACTVHIFPCPPWKSPNDIILNSDRFQNQATVHTPMTFPIKMRNLYILIDFLKMRHKR